MQAIVSGNAQKEILTARYRLHNARYNSQCKSLEELATE